MRKHGQNTFLLTNEDRQKAKALLRFLKTKAPEFLIELDTAIDVIADEGWKYEGTELNLDYLPAN